MAHTEKTLKQDSSAPQDGLGPLLISVDDVGQFLALLPKRLVLGHKSDGRADLPFLANVGAEHAELLRRDSLAQGTVWWVKPLGQERISVNGQEVHEERALRPGDLLQLSDNLSLSFSSPDPASQSCLLELQGAEECLGAQRVLLFAEGVGGRLRLGSGAQRLIRVPNLEHQLALEWSAEHLTISCDAPLLHLGTEPGRQSVQLELPLEDAQQISLGLPAAGRPPFGLGIRSLRPGAQAGEERSS